MHNSMVQPIHFEDFDGHQFERLVFAYFLRTDNWLSLEWYGQTGSDSGRDIWGIRERDGRPQEENVCIACTNRQKIGYNKIEKDFKNALNSPSGKPNVFIVITGGKVSAQLRDKTKKLCEKKQVYRSEIWSRTEFEERLRAKAEPLLKRFIQGEIFPDSPDDLKKFVAGITPQSDDEILALMAGLFDRPAFYTPFNQESSIPAFKKAITDTIEALNTGIHRLRDGTEIRRIPSRHQIKSKMIKQALSQIEKKLGQLRAQYDEFIRSGDIRSCGCNVPDCPTFFINSSSVGRKMDSMRQDILEDFRRLYPSFDVRLGWN